MAGPLPARGASKSCGRTSATASIPSRRSRSRSGRRRPGPPLLHRPDPAPLPAASRRCRALRRRRAAEAQILDPQHRLFLECAWEALENAVCTPSASRARSGGGGEHEHLPHELRPVDRGVNATMGHAGRLLGNMSDALATRVAYKPTCAAPRTASSSFCSTSLVAVHLACQSLLTGAETDMALAGARRSRSRRARDTGSIRLTGARGPSTPRDGNGFGNGLGCVVVAVAMRFGTDRRPGVVPGGARSATTARSSWATPPPASTGRPRSKPSAAGVATPRRSRTSRRTAPPPPSAIPPRSPASPRRGAAGPTSGLLRDRLGEDEHRPPGRAPRCRRPHQDRARPEPDPPALRDPEPPDSLRVSAPSSSRRPAPWESPPGVSVALSAFELGRNATRCAGGSSRPPERRARGSSSWCPRRRRARSTGPRGSAPT